MSKQVVCAGGLGLELGLGSAGQALGGCRSLARAFRPINAGGE